MTSPRPLRKPAWLSAADWSKLLEMNGGAPRCRDCGTTDDLSVDHILARRYQGGNDLANLQFLCVPDNSRKGTRPDGHWSQHFYWDQTPNLARLRTAQRAVYDAVTMDPNISTWFAQPMNMIAGRIYLLAWVVGAGKTLGIPSVAFAVNHLIRRELGSVRRADRILVLAKEEAVRDQLAADLRDDLPGYGIATHPPRVAVVTRSEQFEQSGWLDQHDVVVSCIQQIWEKKGQPNPKLGEVLDGFPLIFVDEPHFGADQVRRIIDTAYRSVVFGLTGSPVNRTGALLNDFVLFSPFTYQDAAFHDRSLKYLDDDSGDLDRFVKEVTVSTADVLSFGQHRLVAGTSDPDYDVHQLAPAENVVEEVIRYMVSCDSELGLAKMGGAAAPHRVEAAVAADLEFRVHAIISCGDVNLARRLCQGTNQFFDANRKKYPREGGWHAEVVHSEVSDGNGDRLAGQRLGTKHAWMRSKTLLDEMEMSYRIDAKCSRVLFVVGMAREGVNNPLCGVVGVTDASSSIVGTVQRTIGRQLRAPVVEAADGVLHVPLARLDTVHIVIHQANQSLDDIRRGIDFVCHMDERLDGLPTIESLLAGTADEVPPLEDPGTGLKLRERLDVAAFTAEVLSGADESRDDPHFMEKLADRTAELFAGSDRRKIELVKQWAVMVCTEPVRAWSALGHKNDIRELEEVPTVVREDERHEPDADHLREFIRRHHPELALFANEDNEALRATRGALYRAWAEQFALPPVPANVTLESIRRAIVHGICKQLGDYLQGERKDIKRRLHMLVGTAVKHVLMVPDDEKAKNESRWDIPQCHVILQRHDIQSAISGWVRGQMIRQGYCPRLARAFGLAS